MRGLLMMLTCAATAACAPAPPYGAPPYGAPPYGAPPPYAPQIPPPYGGPQEDQCGASRHRWLVGRDRAEIPPAPPSRSRRVYSTSDVVTADYSPHRLNIVWDARTGRVLQVKCG